MNRFLTRIVTWVRAGYPDGVPQNDYLPILALLSRRLSADEMEVVARRTDASGRLDNADIGAEITRSPTVCPTPSTSNGCGPSWPPTAGRWTTHETPRTPNSNPASARHPARSVGAVAAGRPRGRARRTRRSPGAHGGRRSSGKRAADDVVAGRRRDRRRRRTGGLHVGNHRHPQGRDADPGRADRQRVGHP